MVSASVSELETSNFGYLLIFEFCWTNILVVQIPWTSYLSNWHPLIFKEETLVAETVTKNNISIFNDEGDPQKSWWKPQFWRATVAYPALVARSISVISLLNGAKLFINFCLFVCLLIFKTILEGNCGLSSFSRKDN